MLSKELRSIYTIAAIALGYVGFRFVTQAGQANPMQNDGYAVFGGVMILIAGIIIGLLIVKKK